MVARLSAATRSHNNSPRDKSGDWSGAIDISRAQGARLLTLRETVSLAALLARNGRGADAVPMLSVARSEVPEGCDLPDVAAAAALLRDLD